MAREDLESLDMQVRQDLFCMFDKGNYNITAVRVAGIISRLIVLAEASRSDAAKLDEVKQAKALAFILGGR